MACTDPETARLAEGYELRLLSEEEQRRMENHALQCDECFQTLYKQGLLTGLLTPAEAPPGRERRPAEEEDLFDGARERMAVRPLPWFRRRCVPVAAGAAAATVILALGIRLMMPAVDPEQTRGPEDGRIQALAPLGEVAPPEALRWNPVSGARAYEVSIHTGRGRLVWRERVDAPPAVLPPEVRQSLQSGKPHFWQVRALLPGGADVESDLVRFTIHE